MIRPIAVLIISSLSLGLAGAYTLAGQETSGMSFRTFTVEGGAVKGTIRGAGPIEWTGKVTVRGAGLTLTADDGLKLWPTADWRDADRVEVTGNVRVEGQYVTPDKATWQISGKAASATYQRSSAEGVMRGAVSFRAVNAATGAVVSAEADKMTYNFKTRQFLLERGDKQVRTEWQEPTPPAAPTPNPQCKEAPGK